VTLQEGVAMPKTTSPIDHQRGRTPLRRDAQQWLLDYLIQETGKVFHFQGTTPDLRAQRREASPTMPTSVGLVLIVHLRHCWSMRFQTAQGATPRRRRFTVRPMESLRLIGCMMQTWPDLRMAP
jgi:hypothetical protein